MHSDGADPGAASTPLGALVGTTHLASAVVKVKSAIGGAVAMRSDMGGMTVGAWRGTVCASWNRNDIRNRRDGVSNPTNCHA
jgi:uncharacterized protein (DUF2342 family)